MSHSHFRYLMMNTGSPRLLVIPNADLNMDNPEAGSYLEQLLTFRKKKSLIEKVKGVFMDVGRLFTKVRGHSYSSRCRMTVCVWVCVVSIRCMYNHVCSR